MIKRITSLALVVVFLVLLSACSAGVPAVVDTATPLPATKPPTTQAPSATPTEIPPTATLEPTATETPLPTATPTPQPYGPDKFPTDVNPLTGLKVSDATLLDRRPVAVKVQLFPRSGRPPWGVSLADIVYDYYQNNGMTRLHAVFYGNNAERVGPIRSGRLFDAAIVRMYKSIFAFGSADARIWERLVSTEFADRLVVEGASNCPPMCRVNPESDNFLVTNTEDLTQWGITKGLDMSRPNLNGMRFDPKAPAGGTSVNEISAHFSISAYVRWQYDPDTGRYLRFQDTAETNTGADGEVYGALVDRLTGDQLAADNVVVIIAPHTYFYRSNSGNSEIIEITASGTGQAYAFRDGQVYKVQWNRPALDSVMYLTFPDGSLYPYKPGTTWYEVLGQSSALSQPSGEAWRFDLRFP